MRFQVLMFEMVEARTPFDSPRGAESDAEFDELYGNIVRVKSTGVAHVFGKEFDAKAGGGDACRDLVSRMLEFRSSDRLGCGQRG